MSSDGSSTQCVIVRNTNGTGILEVKDPALFNLLLQAMTGQVSGTQLISIPQHLPSPFFRELIDEINKAYSTALYTSTWVCLRKLFENLLIEMLRVRYGTTNIDLYYWEDKGRFHDFSVLTENLESRISDFRSYTDAFDQRFFDFLKSFREQANRPAHSIDILTDPNDFENKKSEINHYASLLCDVIRRI